MPDDGTPKDERRRSPCSFTLSYAAGPDEPYTADEWEFIAAMDCYKRERRRPFPAWSEVLAVVRSLGYRKQTQPE